MKSLKSMARSTVVIIFVLTMILVVAIVILIVAAILISNRKEKEPPQKVSRFPLASLTPISDEQFDRQILDAHNYYRRKHKTLPLKANSLLKRSAKSWAKHLLHIQEVQHRPPEERKYGENIYFFKAPIPIHQTGAAPVKSWYDEVTDYNFDSQTQDSSKVTGHFSQIVWKSTTEVGCGRAISQSETATYVVCNYSPAGNVNGQYVSNVFKPRY